MAEFRLHSNLTPQDGFRWGLRARPGQRDLRNVPAVPAGDREEFESLKLGLVSFSRGICPVTTGRSYTYCEDGSLRHRRGLLREEMCSRRDWGASCHGTCSMTPRPVT